mgnify:FL=1
MHRYGVEREQRDAVVTLYSCHAWTGPGRSRWVESFLPIGPYVQTHHVHEKQLRVPVEFKARVDALFTSRNAIEDAKLVREAKDRGIIER